MKKYISIALVLIVIHNCECHFQQLGWGKKLSRWKRYLNFPTGSTAVLQVTLSPGLIWELTNAPIARWNIVLAWDLGFRLPNNTLLAFGSRGRRHSKSCCEVDYFLHRRERRDLYLSIEGMLDTYGIDGHKCVLTTLCEAKHRLKPGRSLVEDVLHIMFTIPYGEGDEFEADGYDLPASDTFCKSLATRCPFSLLEHLLL